MEVYGIQSVVLDSTDPTVVLAPGPSAQYKVISITAVNADDTDPADIDLFLNGVPISFGLEAGSEDFLVYETAIYVPAGSSLSVSSSIADEVTVTVVFASTPTF